MKAIVTRANADGTFDSVGMSNRTVVSAAGMIGLCRDARAFAGRNAVRLEVFSGDRIYGDPSETITLPTQAEPKPSVFVLQGEHYSVPGRLLTVHATRASAEARALELVNVLLNDLHKPKATDYAEGLKRVKKAIGGDGADVWIEEYEVRS